MGLGDNGNSAITGWQYVKKVGSGDFETTWNALSSVVESGSGWPKTYTVTLTGLTNDTAYKFKVRAKNSLGDGAESPESDSLTPVDLTLSSVADQSWVKDIAKTVTLPAASGGRTPLTYSVLGNLPSGLSFNGSTRALSGTASAVASATTYTYKVRDADGSEDTDAFTIAVTNATPTLSGTADQSWVKGIAKTVTLPEASGGDTPLTYSVAGNLPSGLNFNASTRALSGTASAVASAATYTYKVRDANGDEDTDEFTIEVTNATPTLSGTADQSWINGTAVSLTLPAASGGDAPLTYSLAGTPPTGVSFNASTRVLSGTPSATQTATTYTYKVEDANGDEATDEFTIAVEDDTSPTLAATADQSWIKGAAVSLTLPTASGGNAPLTYSLAGSPPTGVSFDTGTRVLSGTPSATQTATTYTYKVEDANGDEATDEFTIAVEDGTSPNLAATADQSWINGTAVSLTLPAASGGDAPLTYSLAGSPPTGVSFNTGTRVLSGTPSATQTATTYTYKVEDANGDEATDEFTITVEDDTSPTLAATADQSWFKDTAVSLTLPAASSGNAPLTYSLAGTPPTGVSFNASTRVLSGTPSATQTATTYTYKVEDANGDEATDEFTIAVEDDTDPTLAATADQSWFKDTAVSLTLPAASSGNAPLTYSLAGSPPTGVSFNASTRVLSGTPSATQTAATYTYKVEDANGDEATDEFTITVEDDTSPTLAATADQSWFKDTAVSLTLPAASSGNAPLTYSLAGTPPTGAELQRHHAGAVGHAVGHADGGHLHLQGRGRERGRGHATEFTIAVEDDTDPTLAATADQSWFKDTAVSLTLPAASSGNAPLTYSLAGSPPTGVSFNASTRVLSGTPSATQTATTYTYKVEDANGDEATDEFTIAVEDDTDPTLAATADQSWFKDTAVSLTLPAASSGNAPLTYSLAGTPPTGVSFNTAHAGAVGHALGHADGDHLHLQGRGRERGRGHG